MNRKSAILYCPIIETDCPSWPSVGASIVGGSMVLQPFCADVVNLFNPISFVSDQTRGASKVIAQGEPEGSGNIIENTMPAYTARDYKCHDGDVSG